MLVQSDIPAVVGGDGLLSSYIGVYRYLVEAPAIISRGSKQYRDGVYRVPRLFRWDYVVEGRQRIAELAAAPENVLSFLEGVAEVCHHYLHPAHAS